MPENAEFVLFPRHELMAFARLVRDLRVVQKASGTGYKTEGDRTNAAGLESKIDAELTKILGA